MDRCLHNQMLQKFYSGLQWKKKDIRVTYRQMNASVSAARGKLLPMDTTENVTKLMIYSGLQKQENHQG